MVRYIVFAGGYIYKIAAIGNRRGKHNMGI